MARLRGDDVLEHVGCWISRLLEERNIDKQAAAEIAVHVTEKIVFNLGGQNIYFPSLDFSKKQKRDREIYRLFNGNNYQELAMNYRLSEMRIRQIVAKFREIERQERLERLR